MARIRPLYAKQPEWADVIPIEQYENANPLAPILYSEAYRDATDYFRGIVKTGEKSPRVLVLTEHIIHLNPAHYSVWQYRYETVKALGQPLEDELALMDDLAIKYLKTYQVWHHRRLLITEIKRPVPELNFITRCLHEDTKNYHTWSYRQWLLSHFNDDDLWVGELDFIDQMLNADVRNNSAWHHRFFVVFQSGVREGEQDRARVIKRELTYVKQSISLAPNNASAWNYLRGILDLNHIPYSTLKEFVELYTTSGDRSNMDVVDLDNPPPSQGAQLPAVVAIEFLADMYEIERDTEKARELWASLANQHDTIRKKYWDHRINESFES
ncbi:hypothetical protein C8J56DRAFT_848717 [Mycena floridula]|nr:hypothetical protein C8J56DRAFT_848717 [Mycena floridula]